MSGLMGTLWLPVNRGDVLGNLQQGCGQFEQGRVVLHQCELSAPLLNSNSFLLIRYYNYSIIY